MCAMTETDHLSTAAGESGANAPIRHIVVIGDALGDLARLRESGPRQDRRGAKWHGPWKLTVLPANEFIGRPPRTELPADTTHIAISIEGNAAIESSNLLRGEPHSYEEALARLSFAADQFEDVIAALIRSALAAGLPTVICTMFPPNHPEPVRQRAASTALAIFNDRIFRRAAEARVSVADLRNVFAGAEDYADARLLSKSGLQKAAGIIERALQGVTAGGERTEVFR